MWGYCVWAKWAIVWVRGGQVWTCGQRVILPMKNLICGQCGQCVLMSVNLKMYVILSNYTVGVWLTNAHTPRFGERFKTRGYNAHIVHKCPRMARARMAHGPGQRASGLCGHCPHYPPLKYYKLQAGGRVPVAACRWPFAWRGEGRAGGQGPRQRRGHKQNFL